MPEVRTLHGDSPGPTLALLGGVHGDELEGVLAVRRVVHRLSSMPLRGRVVWAAPAHPEAWQAYRRVSPSDGLNLARVFPGDAGGQPTERVAAHLTKELISHADFLIDLHSAGTTFDMPFLIGYHNEGPLASDAAAAAAAFGAPFIWQHPDSPSGRSLSAAEELGIPSVYVESRGGGHVRKQDLDGYVFGVLRTMAHLGMLAGGSSGDRLGPSSLVVRGDGNTDEGIVSRCTGYFIASVEVGDLVERGAVLGVVVDGDGIEIESVASSRGGAVMLLRRDARVEVGDTLAITADVVGENTCVGSVRG